MQKDICAGMFTVALLAVTQNKISLNIHQGENELIKLWFTNSMEHSSAIKKNETELCYQGG
jgi:hypothetical protein